MNQRTKLIYEIRDIKKEFNGITALQIGRLQFHPGTVYGIIGAVGSGKSTLLSIMAGLVKPTSGVVKYDNAEFETNWLGKTILNDEIYLASPERLPLNSKIKNIITDLNPKKADRIKGRFFSRGKQKTYWDIQLKNLSPGEISWVSKILAVESDPRLLLIDDYGTIIDSAMERDFRKRLIKMNKDLGTTIILAAPTDNQIKKFASVLIHLDNGHVSKIRPGHKAQIRRR